MSKSAEWAARDEQRKIQGGSMTIYRLTVNQDWRDGNSPPDTCYDFSTLRDAEQAQAMLINITAPITDDLFCSSVIDEVDE